MIDRLILTNLRRAQAFDRNLRAASGIESLSTQFIEAIMFNSNPSKRREKIATLKDKIYSHVESEVMPQADRIGARNAADVSAKLPEPFDRLPERERQLSLFSGNMRKAERLKILRASINAKGENLDARLQRYGLEPAEGTEKQKVERLREIHTRLEEKRKTFERNQAAFNSGETKTRPSKPNLDYGSAFTSDVKRDVREQARRAGTDAEIAHFRSKGYKKFVWVAPNGVVACPDCMLRQSVALTMEEWEANGRPGSGLTICGASCFCMLLPVEVHTVSPSLITRHTTSAAGPMTSLAQLEFFNRNRIRR